MKNKGERIETLQTTFGNFKALIFLDDYKYEGRVKDSVRHTLNETNILCAKIDKITDREFRVWCAENMQTSIKARIVKKNLPAPVVSRLHNFIAAKKRILIHGTKRKRFI